MTYEECKAAVAKKYGLVNPSSKGPKTLVTGHLTKYFEEAAMMFAEEQCRIRYKTCQEDKNKNNNEKP